MEGELINWIFGGTKSIKPIVPNDLEKGLSFATEEINHRLYSGVR